MSEFDCEQVWQFVWQFLDGEVDAAEYAKIKAHVAGCAECGSRYEFQRQLLALIEQKCREGPVPVELKSRLFRLLED